jgi:hypothetical protein
LFLQSLAGWKPEEIEPDSVQEDRRGWANTVLELIGEDHPDDLEKMALGSLARATVALCEDPQDADEKRGSRTPAETYWRSSGSPLNVAGP